MKHRGHLPGAPAVVKDLTVSFYSESSAGLT
jgi:hypothetical protein